VIGMSDQHVAEPACQCRTESKAIASSISDACCEMASLLGMNAEARCSELPLVLSTIKDELLLG
jgi:hypothetical protein